MRTKGTIGQLVLNLQELVRVQMENGARLLLVNDRGAADALEIRREAYQDVLDLIAKKTTVEKLIEESSTAITKYVPPLPKT